MTQYSIVLGGDLADGSFNEANVPAYSLAVKEMLRNLDRCKWVETRAKLNHIEVVVEVSGPSDEVEFDQVQENLVPALSALILAGQNILHPGLWGIVCLTATVPSAAELINFNNQLTSFMEGADPLTTVH